MSTIDWLEELRAGNGEAALTMLRSHENSPAIHYSLGSALMWLGDFQSALEHFEHGIRVSRVGVGDMEFGMAGAAAWCLGKAEEAVKYWERGTKAKRAIAGANTRTALLLYAVSFLRSTSFQTEKAEELLAKKLAQHWTTGWPDPIAEFVLDQTGEDELRKAAVYKNKSFTGLDPHIWQLQFYKRLKSAKPEAQLGSSLRMTLEELTVVLGTEYVEGEKFFYFLRMEEFYLLRHECSGH